MKWWYSFEILCYNKCLLFVFPLKCQMPRLEGHCWSCSCSSRMKDKDLSSASWVSSKAEEMMSIITSVMRHAYGSLHSIRSANLIRRGLVLFTIGVFLALVLNLLQIQRNVTLFPEEVIATLFSSAWWIPPSCGTAAGKANAVFQTRFKLMTNYFVWGYWVLLSTYKCRAQTKDVCR